MPLVGTMVVIAAQQMYGWMGVAVVAGGLLMWLLLHFNRTMAVLRKAADRPIGHVGSAVMLNARLQAGVSLMHVVAMTRSLGALQSPENEQPEFYRWIDGTRSHVTCEFHNGKLVKWVLERPSAPEDAQDGTAGSAAP